MTQIVKLVLVVMIFGALSLGARSARACGEGGGGPDAGAIGLIVGTYAGVTIGFGIGDLAVRDHSVGYGVAETLIHGPLALLFGTALRDRLQYDAGYDNSDEEYTLGTLTVMHAAMAIHGIYTIARHRDRKPPPTTFQVGSVRGTVTPTPIQNGAGVGIVGSF